MGRKRIPSAAAAAGRLPDFVIIGAMRAGSTSLARYVGAHPGVSMPSRKELHFFDWQWDKGLDWYRAQFRGAAPGAIAGEATPIYMVYHEAMERLAATIPGARLLVVLRDPVARAYSHYWYNRMLGFEALGFREALEAEASRPSGSTDRRTFDYVERGRYLVQLERVCALFPRESLHVVILEDLVGAPAPTYTEVCRFLGIDASFLPPNIGEPMNSHAVYRSKVVAKLARAMPEPLRSAARRMNRREARYEPMDPELRRELVLRFRYENEALAAWLGKDLSGWGQAGDRERPARRP
ncbi:MAG: sulfotransferase family protein [Actinomycetota bacterium]